MTVRLALSTCLAPLGARLVGNDADFEGVSINTRTDAVGAVYVAIRGDRFDGHDFISEAENSGVVALIVEHEVESDLPQLVVSDTTQALGDLAHYWLSRNPVPLIAITGSNGKTTTKEIITSILSELGPVLATRGNLNNHIGVPLTLFELTQEHRYAVIEMGASGPGDIARLVEIAPPDVAVLTNVGAAHLKGFGSLDGVARAKSEIYAGLGRQGAAVINLDDAYSPLFRDSTIGRRRRTFGVSAQADVRGVSGPGLQIETFGRGLRADFPLLGDHNGMNALAAVAAVQCLDVQDRAILSGLAKVRNVGGRLEEKRGAGGVQLIDDSYNANPNSVSAAVELLARRTGRRHLVLGEMLELGADSERMHAEIGRLAKQRGIERLWTLGAAAEPAARAFEDGGRAFEDLASLVQALSESLHEKDTVLIKGSRGARMERVVTALQQAPEAVS
jgi:UDP-N-acetylmuramoyl-tripeptide--D-alanyl-D-alanine ligase